MRETSPYTAFWVVAGLLAVAIAGVTVAVTGEIGWALLALCGLCWIGVVLFQARR